MRWPLGVEGTFKLTERKNGISESYNHKELNSANDHVSGDAGPTTAEPLDENPVLAGTLIVVALETLQ